MYSPAGLLPTDLGREWDVVTVDRVLGALGELADTCCAGVALDPLKRPRERLVSRGRPSYSARMFWDLIEGVADALELGDAVQIGEETHMHGLPLDHMLFVPVRCAGALVAVFCLGREVGASFSDHEISRLESLAEENAPLLAFVAARPDSDTDPLAGRLPRCVLERHFAVLQRRACLQGRALTLARFELAFGERFSGRDGVPGADAVRRGVERRLIDEMGAALSYVGRWAEDEFLVVLEVRTVHRLWKRPGQSSAALEKASWDPSSHGPR